MAKAMFADDAMAAERVLKSSLKLLAFLFTVVNIIRIMSSHLRNKTLASHRRFQHHLRCWGLPPTQLFDRMAGLNLAPGAFLSVFRCLVLLFNTT